MNLCFKLICLFVLILRTVYGDSVCPHICRCSKNNDTVNCDSKNLNTLANLDFPSDVITLTFIDNQLTLATSDDRAKIGNLSKLQTLSLNRNPLVKIPELNNIKFKSLSLQDALLTSAQFPSNYSTCTVQRIFLSNNKIRSIGAEDFIYLKDSQVTKLDIDSSSISTIDQNAFMPLSKLQSLSLKKNLLSSAAFLSSMLSLSSIELDENSFTSLPQELAAPRKLRTFSFTKNLISVIDESSPLHTWMKINDTNLKLNLTDNPFDCCQSLWFIRFLNTFSRFIPDAAKLKCAKPADYVGQFLVKLNPDTMNCGGIPPSTPWWTTDRIIAVSIGGLIITVAIITGVTFLVIRQRRLRSAYIEIDGSVDPSPTAPPASSSEHQYPAYGEDNDDAFSSVSAAATVHTTGSRAPTHSMTGDRSPLLNTNRH